MHSIRKLKSLFQKNPLWFNRILYRIIYSGDYKSMLKKRYSKKRDSSFEKNSLKGFLKTGLMFVHIPKCAGISLNYTLYGNKGGGHSCSLEYKLFFSSRNYNKLFKFAVVRNPIDRVFSAYQFLKNGGRNDWDKNFAERTVNKYLNFEDFVLHWLDEQNIYDGIHFVPQFEFVCDLDGDVIVDHLVHYERLEEEYIDIIRPKAKCQLPAKLSRKNITKRIEKKEMHSQSVIDKIRRIYKKDFELLGY